MTPGRRFRHQQLRTFGIGKALTQQRWSSDFRQMWQVACYGGDGSLTVGLI